MSVKKALTVLSVLAWVASVATFAVADPLITAVVEHGSLVGATPQALDAQGPVVSSASVSGGSGTSGALGDETFQFADRTHEYTNPRTTAAGVLQASNRRSRFRLPCVEGSRACAQIPVHSESPPRL